LPSFEFGSKSYDCLKMNSPNLDLFLRTQGTKDGDLRWQRVGDDQHKWEKNKI
jgi:hypothetical protein